MEVRTYQRAIDVEVNAWYSMAGWLKEWGPVTGLSIPVVVAGVWAYLRHVRDKPRTRRKRRR